MNSKELKRWLADKGCTFDTKKGCSGHLIVKLGDKDHQNKNANRKHEENPLQHMIKAEGWWIHFGFDYFYRIWTHYLKFL